ncbi:MAG: alpha/beta hydrolase [Mycobacteriaceae bacterium]
MTRREITFPSAGTTCAAWHLPATDDAFAGAHGRPCVVMAHGFSGTRDTGLLGYAEDFARAGLDVLLFDYRGFGDSSGTPRQLVSYRRQRRDYQAAVQAARGIEGVDPERIILWGTSYSGGHVLHVAAQDPAIAAVVSMTPFLDGLTTLRHLARQSGLPALVRLLAAGVHDAAAVATRRSPRLVPAIGPVGSDAVLARDGAAETMAAIAGPTWRNEVCARVSLEVAMNRPIRSAPNLRAPWLLQIGDRDTVVPPATALTAADRAGATVETRRYPVDHFDVYLDPWQQRLLTDQLDFLARHVHPSPNPVRTGSASPKPNSRNPEGP